MLISSATSGESTHKDNRHTATCINNLNYGNLIFYFGYSIRIRKEKQLINEKKKISQFLIGTNQWSLKISIPHKSHELNIAVQWIKHSHKIIPVLRQLFCLPIQNRSTFRSATTFRGKISNLGKFKKRKKEEK